jgi:hypothetical protein
LNPTKIETLAGAHSPVQELQRQRRLTGARIALDEVEASATKAAHQDVVQASDVGGHRVFDSSLAH